MLKEGGRIRLSTLTMTVTHSPSAAANSVTVAMSRARHRMNFILESKTEAEVRQYHVLCNISSRLNTIIAVPLSCRRNNSKRNEANLNG